MRIFSLSDHPAFSTSRAVQFIEHSIFTCDVSRFELPEHQSGFGLIFSTTGSFQVWVNGSARPVDNDHFLVVNRASKVRLIVSKSARPLMLYFQSEMLSPSNDWTLVERVYPANEAFKKRMDVLSSLPSSCSSFVTMQGDSIIRSILSDIIEYDLHSTDIAEQIDVKKRSTRDENYKRIAAVREWMEDHFHEQVSLKHLSEMSAINHQHFLRMFSKLFRKTPKQYLIDLRLSEAKRLLVETELKVDEICEAVGWTSLGTFADMFKHRTGHTPGDFRKRSMP